MTTSADTEANPPPPPPPPTPEEAEASEAVVITVRCEEGNVSEKGSRVDVVAAMADEEKEEEFEKVCRICHLSPDRTVEEGSELIAIGCGCKNELGAAHRHCAETWFRLKGNRYCYYF